jgi:hypothetical protein
MIFSSSQQSSVAHCIRIYDTYEITSWKAQPFGMAEFGITADQPVRRGRPPLNALRRKIVWYRAAPKVCWSQAHFNNVTPCWKT